MGGVLLLSCRESPVLPRGGIDTLTGVVRGLRPPALGFSKGMSSPLAKSGVQSHDRGGERPMQAMRRAGREFTLGIEVYSKS